MTPYRAAGPSFLHRHSRPPPTVIPAKAGIHRPLLKTPVRFCRGFLDSRFRGNDGGGVGVGALLGRPPVGRRSTAGGVAVGVA